MKMWYAALKMEKEKSGTAPTMLKKKISKQKKVGLKLQGTLGLLPLQLCYYV